MIFKPAEADSANERIDVLTRLGIEPALHFEREHHVLQRGSPRQQIVFLRDVADAARQTGTQRLRIVQRRNLRLEFYFAAIRHVDLRDHIQQRGLARARRSDDGQKFAVGDGEVQVLNHPQRLIAAGAAGKSLGEIADFEKRRRHVRFLPAA